LGTSSLITSNWEHIKVMAGIALIISIFCLVLANIAYIIFTMVKGKAKLKE